MTIFLKKNSWWIIIFLCIGGYFAFFQEKPCASPIKYKVGYFDIRFGISKKSFLDNINIATNIWEKSIGKNLFEYNQSGDLTINLKYDDRQKTTQQNQVLKADINKTTKLAVSLRQQYLSLEDQYEVAETEYKNQLIKFKQDQDKYNSEVERWNSIGGAPKKEYARLTQEKNDLIAMSVSVENKRLLVNSLAGEINTFINKYNLLVNDVNSNVETINRTAGEEFEEGVYNPNYNQIDIYQFSDNKKLIRVLTHELGHALNLDHNDNPKSIMYSLNIGDNEFLSSDDLTELKTKCQL